MTTTQPPTTDETGAAPGYAIAHLRTPQLNADVFEYLERIDATLGPFGGRFLIHGADVEVREGEWPGTIVVIGFPTVDLARSWYDSDDYQAILPLRTRNIDGSAVIVEGVCDGYDPAALVAAARAVG